MTGDQCVFTCDIGYQPAGQHICTPEGRFSGGTCVEPSISTKTLLVLTCGLLVLLGGICVSFFEWHRQRTLQLIDLTKGEIQLRAYLPWMSDGKPMHPEEMLAVHEGRVPDKDELQLQRIDACLAASSQGGTPAGEEITTQAVDLLFELYADTDGNGHLDSDEYSHYLRGIGAWGLGNYTDEGWAERWPEECKLLGCNVKEGVSPAGFREKLYGPELRGHLAVQDLALARKSMTRVGGSSPLPETLLP
jgi:hypothetical protein